MPHINHNKKVLVILASYNGDKWISEQIDSILSQRGVCVDLLISDDASNDQTQSIISEQYLSRPNITLIKRTMNIGRAGQHFLEILKAANLLGYDYLALADQDDIWMADKLETAILNLTSNKCHGYSSPTIAFWPNKKKRLIKQSTEIKRLDFLFEGAGQGCTFVLTHAAASRVQKFITECNLTKKIFYHDWLIYLLIRVWGLGWHFDNVAKIYYRQHSGNDTGARIGLRALLQRLERIKSGWYTEQILHMSKIADIATTPCQVKLDFNKVLHHHNSLIRKILLCVIIFKHGRRRLSDRFIMAIFVICNLVLNKNRNRNVK